MLDLEHRLASTNYFAHLAGRGMCVGRGPAAGTAAPWHALDMRTC